MDDLKKVLGHRSGSPAERISYSSIVTVLLNAYEEIRGNEPVSETDFRHLLTEGLDPQSIQNTLMGTSGDYRIRLVSCLLGRIAICPVIDGKGSPIITVGKADAAVLPLAEGV